MSTRERTEAARATVAPTRLVPALLVASAVNPEGNIDLAVGDGQGGRAEFYIGPEGELYQRRYWQSPTQRFRHVVVHRRGGEEPLDMAFFAACLSGTLGEHTPELFRLERSGRLVLQGAERDGERLRILRDAFNIYLLAYEERLV